MREIIKAGTVLFKEGTLLPDGLTFQKEADRVKKETDDLEVERQKNIKTLRP